MGGEKSNDGWAQNWGYVRTGILKVFPVMTSIFWVKQGKRLLADSEEGDTR